MKKEELINYVLANDDLDPITSACAEYLHCPLVVIAKSLAIISYSNTFIIPDFPWQNAVKRGYITLEFGTALNNWEYLRDQNNPMDCITVNEISQYRRRFYKLTYCNHFVGYLNIGELDRNFDEIPEEDINLVRGIIAKEVFIRRKFIKSSSTDEEILISLINYEYVDRLHYLEVVNGTRFAKENNYRIACMNIHHHTSYNAGEDTLKNKLLEFFPGSCIVVFDEIMTIAFTDDSSILQNAQNLKRLNAFLNKIQLPLAYSGIFHDMFNAASYKAQAMFALEHKPDRRMIIDYAEVQLLDLLYQVDRSKLENYCSPEIIAVHQYDTEHHSEYIKTISTYIQEGGSSKMTSALLNIHRNTLLYRTEQIEILFHIDLSHTEMWTQYRVSCYIIQILKQ
jgi:hypothetical protein